MDRQTNSICTILFKAALALCVSALCLTLLVVMSVETPQPVAADLPRSIAISGNSLQVVVGTGQVTAETLDITGYHLENGELSAIAVCRGGFQAQDYPLLNYRIDTDFPGPEMKLIWRTADDPAALHHTDLSATDPTGSWLDLSEHPDWNGTVLEIGVYAFANDPEEKLSISHLTLEPLSWRGVLASDWAQWTRFRGWSAQSINVLYGTVDAWALSPVVAAAAWSALAVLLLVIAGLFTGGVHWSALAAVLLVPWISLDLLWQKELSTQLVSTRDQFAGKTMHERHLADTDRDIYRYITRLKDQVLPAEVSRIVLLHESKGHNFERLKAQYYLLPNNVYNFGRMPPEAGLENVDYILLLGEVPNLEFRAQTHSLVWRQGKHSQPVALVDSDPMGTLYRVLPPTDTGAQEL